MLITVEVRQSELWQLDLDPKDVEEVVWAMVEGQIDPNSFVDVELDINVVN